MLLRLLTALCGVLLAWAGFLAISGGFYTRLGSVRISSRNPIAPFSLAVLCAVAIVVIAWLTGAPGPFEEERTRLKSAWARARARFGDRLGSVAGLAGLCLLVSVVATLYFFHWAADAPLWLDEQMIALNIRDRTVPQLVGTLWFGQAAPYGWLVAERTMLILFGPQGVNLRFLPLLLGISSVAVAAWIGRRWLTTAAALLLVALSGFGDWLAHYTFEVKHYSADRLTSLLLPALVAWTLDAADQRTFLKRAGIWWFVAAVAQWFSLGATLVTPGCAVVLLLFAWRRYGTRTAIGAGFGGWVFALAFGLHYLIALQFTHHSSFLQSYWASRLPPASLGPSGLMIWLRDQLEPLASNPGGTRLWIAFWAVGISGLLFGSRRTLGLAFLPVPISAFVFAVIGQVPLYERFSLWIVPALHVGIALAVDRAVRWLFAWRERRGLQLAAAAALVAVGYALGNDIITRGWRGELAPRPHEQNHGLNDREAVRFVKERMRAGDVILTTKLGWPAIWWYAVISSRDGKDDPIQHSGIGDGGGGIGFLKMVQDRNATECDIAALRAAVAPYERAIVFVSFPDEGEGFAELAVRRLSVLGRVISMNDFSAITRVAIIDLRTPQTIDSAFALDDDFATRAARNTPKMPDGCVVVTPVERW